MLYVFTIAIRCGVGLCAREWSIKPSNSIQKSDNDQYLLNSSMHARAEHTRKLDARLERFFVRPLSQPLTLSVFSPLSPLDCWGICLFDGFACFAPSSLLQ